MSKSSHVTTMNSSVLNEIETFDGNQTSRLNERFQNVEVVAGVLGTKIIHLHLFLHIHKQMYLVQVLHPKSH